MEFKEISPANILSLSALVISILTLVLVFVRARKRPGKGRQRLKEIPENGLKIDPGILSHSDLQSNRQLSDLASKLKALEGRVQQLNHPVREMEWEVRRTAVEQGGEPAIAQESTPQDMSETQRTVYAKLADLHDGFSPAIISQTQNGEQAYEIEITGDSAVYRISSDPDAQRYAFAELSYTLGPACEFLNQPFKGSQIVGLGDGFLEKSGDNWVIRKKTQIEFR